MTKTDLIKLIGLAGLVLGTAASAVSQYAQEKQMEELIDVKVQEALAKKEEED